MAILDLRCEEREEANHSERCLGPLQPMKRQCGWRVFDGIFAGWRFRCFKWSNLIFYVVYSIFHLTWIFEKTSNTHSFLFPTSFHHSIVNARDCWNFIKWERFRLHHEEAFKRQECQRHFLRGSEYKLTYVPKSRGIERHQKALWNITGNL